MPNRTWGDLRTIIRRSYLRDTGGKKWEDAALLDYVNLALIDLAGHMPVPKVASLQLGAVTGKLYTTVALPTDLVRIDRIIWDNGSLVPEHDLLHDPLPTTITSSTDMTYLLDYEATDTLTFFRTPTGTVRLLYGAYMSAISADNTTIPIGRHLWQEAAISCYVTMMAHLRESVSRANLEQWSQKPDNLVGNPLTEEADAWYKQYQRLLRENINRD